MDEDSSNDVMLIEIDEDEDTKPSIFNLSSESPPIMSLFERLISNDTKSNTILTNAQILAILDKEFNMDISKLHELEVEIYINVVKKFLKDWPQWDVFDRVISKLKKKSEHAKIKSLLEEKYKHLKQYLNSMIEMATPLAEEAIKKLKDKPSEKTKDEEKTDIVLEIYCTRKMLNNFIYSQPHPAENNSIFNLIDFKPYRLNPALPHYTFTSMLHWYGICFSIELPYFQFTRQTAHQLHHTLVNQANGPRELNKEYDTSIYMKSTRSMTDSVPIIQIMLLLDKIRHHYKDKLENGMIKEIFNVIKSDLYLNSTTVEVPGSYRQHSSKHPYVRKLCTEINKDETTKNNLFIEETITPIQDWSIGKYVNISQPSVSNLQTWLKFECGECKQKFHGAEFLTLLRNHFKIFHINEPDWTCVNCNKSFNMANLTHNGWKHIC